jgi:hypothetical protein
MERLIRNQIKCLHCGDIIESTHTHHLVACTCKRVMIDGGLDYSRILGNSEDYEDHCKWMVSNPLTQKNIESHSD